MSKLEHEYWIINGEQFLAALNRVEDGENPDIVYTDLYAHSDIEDIAPVEET